MTWDHRRAVDPLLGTLPGFRMRHPQIEVEWAKRPLSGFEFTPVCELARAYDLIVLDHPFMGDVAVEQCLMPLDSLIAEELEEAFVGPSLASYRYGGRLWALPIDAACQVAVSRPDLLEGADEAAPRNWAELLALGRRLQRHGLRLAIALRGVHSLMTFFTLCANLGRPCSSEPQQPLIDRETAQPALEAMRELLSLCPPAVLDWNSIALHDAMVARDDLVFCPAVYCYATYAEADQRRPLRFHDLPGPEGLGGSTVGGTGLGISASCRHPEAALAYARYLAESATQLAFARHRGQPARREAWEDEALNARFGDCFRSTRATIEAAWVRPRYPGYLGFQARGGELVEQHLRGALSDSELLVRLEAARSPGEASA
jgi:multiple sugar transport system substrate-binding protein